MFRKRILGQIERKSPGRRMVEIGGGTGSFGVLAQSRGWEYVDYDISETAIQFARQLGVKAELFGVDDVPPLPEDSTDVVVMWEVIEHVWNIHDYLSVIHKALIPGGLFVLSTPNSGTMRHVERWEPIGLPPIHSSFFTADSLERSLRRHGFEPARVYGRRLYLPRLSFRSIRLAMSYALRLIPPETLIAIAVRK